MFVSAARSSVRLATKARTTPLRCFAQPFSDEAKTGAAAESKKEEEIEPAQVPPVGGENKTDADVIAGLQNEIKNLKDQLLRSYAEGENIRRIAQRDVDNARSYAVSSFAKATLDIADDLERAIAVVPVEKKTSGDPVLTQLVLGIELTQKNLGKVREEINTMFLFIG